MFYLGVLFFAFSNRIFLIQFSNCTLLVVFIYEHYWKYLSLKRRTLKKKIRFCRQGNFLFIHNREVFLFCCCCCFVFCSVVFISTMILNHDLFYLDSVTYKACQFWEKNKEKTLLVLKT